MPIILFRPFFYFFNWNVQLKCEHIFVLCYWDLKLWRPKSFQLIFEHIVDSKQTAIVSIMLTGSVCLKRCKSKLDGLRKSTHQRPIWKMSWSHRDWAGWKKDYWACSAMGLLWVLHTLAFHFSTWSGSFAQQAGLGLLTQPHPPTWPHLSLGQQSSWSFPL